MLPRLEAIRERGMAQAASRPHMDEQGQHKYDQELQRQIDEGKKGRRRGITKGIGATVIEKAKRKRGSG